MLTWIFEVVFGSRNDLTVFHKSLNPEPALMMNMRFKVCCKQEIIHKKYEKEKENQEKNKMWI